MARNGLVSNFAAAALVGGALALAGCGGGGSEGGVDRPPAGYRLGNVPTVFKLQTPLGLAGSRGSGPDVFVALNLKDREFNQSDVQMEFGYDVNGDGQITPSLGDPTTTDEFFPCSPALDPFGKPVSGESLIGLDTAGGKAGADHLFVWRSSTDVPGARFVTLDYDYSDQGRPQNGSDGLPLFVNTPGIKLRARANDGGGDPSRWGPWNTTVAFDLNNNNQPTVNIDETIGLFGVSPNATGIAADENVVLNLRFTDNDSDLMAVSVDWAQVPEAAFLGDPNVVAALQWFPATTFAGTADTNLPSSPGAGTPATYSWDSVADAGTVNGRFILRATPFDAKSELGPTATMDDGLASLRDFRLDNYTIFTDPAAALSQARVGHRATTLANDRVLITGGRTTVAGASVATAELFFPGIGETTLGAVAATAPMATARSFHSQTRLFDDRVLVIGGFSAAGGALNSVEIYDPVAGTWQTLGGASLTTARARHTATLLPNGNVLVTGGVDGAGSALNSAEIFQVSNNDSVPVAEAMSAARHSVDGVLLPNGRVLIPGGKNTAGSGLSSVEMYDPKDNGGVGGFVAAPSMGAARADHSVSLTTDGRVFVTGGTGLSSVEVFDPIGNAWTSRAAMSSPRAGHVGVLTGDGRIVVAGGHNGTTVVGTAQVYVPTSNSYDATNGSMRTARRDAAVTVLNNGRVLIVGGTDAGGTTLSSLEIYSPDGGFNFGPTAKIATPTESQSWAFGALLPYRLLDAETDAGRVLFQYSISGGPWQFCTSSGGVTNDGLPDTIAGDVNEGMVSIPTVAADSSLPIDPVLQNTVGDHLFVWDIDSDLAQADYDAVKVRVIPFGAARGVLATTTSFKIVRNTKVIPQFAGFAAPAHGNIQFDYHLRDIDAGADPALGDMARVVFEFARDLNGDQQILSDDGESWTVCTTAPGGEAIGSPGNYPLVTSTAAPGAIGTTGWHLFIWDSVRDLGSPNPTEIFTDVIVRITPFDFPSTDLEETQGRQEVLGNAQGFQIDIDPTGLFLVSWRVQGGTTYGGSAIPGVRLDERIIFTFSNEVEPSTVDGTVGRTTLPITVGGRQVLGTYAANPADYREVVFYPQLNNIVNGAPQYNGTENPTILTRNVQVGIYIPGYVPGSDPASANVLRLRFPGAGGTAVEIVNLPTLTFAPGFVTTNAAGLAAFFPNGAAGAPTYITSTPTNGQANQALNAGISITLDGQVSAETFNPAAIKFRVDVDGDGFADPNDSVIPGTVSISNTAGPNGGAVITFTPNSSFPYPGTSTILVDFSGARAGDGTLADGGSGNLGRTSFGTVAGSAPQTVSFTEQFTSNTQNDTNVTNALWNSSLYPGVLTGLRDGGDGTDGTPSANATGLTTFSAKNVWNFSSLTINTSQRWLFTGGGSNLPVEIRVTGSVDIAGVLDVSGGDGTGSQSSVNSSTGATYQSPYGLRYASPPSNSANALIGGAGNAGGGRGGTSRHLTSGVAGGVGTGGSSSSPGGAGSLFSSNYAGGAGGGGHAQAGQAGGVYSSGYSGAGAAGSSYGNSSFSSGLTAGSGGGAGASSPSYYTITDQITWGSSSTQTFYYTHSGGSGGGGGGALKIACNGTFVLRGSGIIDASGGDGGNGFYYYSGGGGGGSGGSVWILSAGAFTQGGIIDIRGGAGGVSFPYIASYTTGSPARYGTFGGHASAGRIRIEAPNVGSTTTNFIAGTHINTITQASLNGGDGSRGAFPSGTAINIDTIPKDAQGFMNFTTMNIAAGTTVTLTGTAPAKMRFTGNVSIAGVLSAKGYNGNSGLAQSGSASNIPGGLAGPGGGIGGVPLTSGSTSRSNGGDGKDSAGGTTGGGEGGKLSNLYSSNYYYGCSSGGGGANHINFTGRPMGTTVGGFSANYNAFGWSGNVHDYMGSGFGCARTVGQAGTGFNDPVGLTMSNLRGGSGGGAGATGGFSTTYYGGSSGAGGGGAIGIETSGTFTLGSAGRIDLRGGDMVNASGTPIYSSSYQFAGSGAGGAGGTLLVRASTLSISSGATVDTIGGIGGHSYTVPYQYNMGSGGTGGVGVARFESVNAANFLNYGGIFGYSSTTGSITTASYASGDRGATFWTTAAGLSPDFSNSAVTFEGNVQLRLEGAQPHPVSGVRDDTNAGFQDLGTSSLNAGFGDAADGYKYWRMFFQLAIGSPPPTVDGVSFDVTTK